MNAAMLTTAPTRCPRCNGQMYREQSDEFCCLSCGEYVFVERRGPSLRPSAPSSPRTAVVTLPTAASTAA
jgi:hypothetical protein